MPDTLVAALASCAEGPLQPQTSRFLQGLSSDELLFLADFLGASIVESSGHCHCSRAELAGRIAAFQEARRAAANALDQDHKMILLLEYLNLSGLDRMAVKVRAAGR